jgi:hypothetical protein
MNADMNINELTYQINGKGVKEMSRAKIERRQQLAKLPFEEKIPILLHLQRIAVGISRAGGRKRHQVWK